MAETDWIWVYENPKDAAAEIDRLRTAIETVAKTFEKDIEQGFRTRDKEFAITILRSVVPRDSGQGALKP